MSEPTRDDIDSLRQEIIPEYPEMEPGTRSAAIEREVARLQNTDTLNETRVALLEAAIRHVLRYGKVGKQSEARLRAALRAVEVSRG